jgi:hypothetical protein
MEIEDRLFLISGCGMGHVKVWDFENEVIK